MDWLKRMNSVLDYIENNLDGEIDDHKIAMLSASSKGMFQRFFAVITDMTLSEYIRKRRLTQAAFDIRNTDEKIIDIAIKYGYNSASAFSTAFKDFHGITPSYARTPSVKFQSFRRFTFTLTLSVKGGKDMQYHISENAEKIMQKMLNKQHSWEFLRNVSERNGTKIACDSHRVAIILPEGKADWNFDDAYFETGDKEHPRSNFQKVFEQRNDSSSFNFQISKKQAPGLLNYFNGLELKENAKPELVGLNVNTMEIIEMQSAKELAAKPNECIIGFNKRYLKEAFDFIMCSDDEYIEIYYTGSHSAFIMKSARLYIAVLPVRMREDESV